MECSRLFMIGLVVLFLGIQLRLVKTYELKPKASQFVQQRIAQKANTDTQPVGYGYSDVYWPDLPPVDPTPKLHTITPPKWLGWSLISVGAVLVLTCPCFKK